MEPKVILEYVSLGSAILGPIVAWITKNIVARWRSDALIERIKDKEEMRRWIQTVHAALLPRSEADLQFKRLEDFHDELRTTVDRNEERLRMVEQLRCYTHRPNPDARQ